MGCRPVPEEKQWRRKGWGRERGGEALVGGEVGNWEEGREGKLWLG